MGLTKYKLGDLICQRREKYDGISSLPIRGVSRDGFIEAKQPGADTNLYNTFYYKDFVFNPARMEINSIALNVEYEKAICSSLYEVFYVKDESIILPEYLNLFIKRDEFARLCEFIGWGSAREYCRVNDIGDIDIELPPLDIQQKYVAVYNTMLANQKNYERGIDDLKLVCEGYLDKLKGTLPLKRIGDYIELSEEKNLEAKYGLENVRGVSIDKRFIETKADMKGVNLYPYNVVRPNDFVYVTVTSRNSEKISLAYNESRDTYICSSSYVVFRSKDKEILLPRYLRIYFERSEFNRYARFNSWGSARETFDYSEMEEVCIPIPNIQIQESIADIFDSYTTRRNINERLKAQIKDLCPILIKGAMEEAST